MYFDNISLQIDEISSKLDVSIANQMKLMAFLLPHEKVAIRLHNLPALSLKSVTDFWTFEKYLKNQENLSAVVNCIDFMIIQLSNCHLYFCVSYFAFYNCLFYNNFPPHYLVA